MKFFRDAVQYAKRASNAPFSLRIWAITPISLIAFIVINTYAERQVEMEMRKINYHREKVGTRKSYSGGGIIPMHVEESPVYAWKPDSQNTPLATNQNESKTNRL